MSVDSIYTLAKKKKKKKKRVAQKTVNSMIQNDNKVCSSVPRFSDTIPAF